MNPQKKRRSRVVEVGKGPAKVRIYTITRKDGYPISDKRLREMRRMVAQRSWAERKRREDRNPPRRQ